MMSITRKIKKIAAWRRAVRRRQRLGRLSKWAIAKRTAELLTRGLRTRDARLEAVI